LGSVAESGPPVIVTASGFVSAEAPGLKTNPRRTTADPTAIRRRIDLTAPLYVG
jgi:hypothetical protein